MEAGTLKRPITIEAPSVTQDSFGQPAETEWTTLLQTWASIDTITSKEAYALGAGFTSQVTHKITIRYHPVYIGAGYRVLFRGHTYVVQAVSDPDEQRVQLDLMCLELSK